MSGSMGDMGHLLSAAQRMHKALEEAKRELREAGVEGTAGGGVVRVAFDGELAPGAVSISEEAYAAGRDTLEELLAAALADGFAKAARLRDGRLKDVTGGLDLPGLS
jgi:DNA-binding YbaB/EbfC family protein